MKSLEYGRPFYILMLLGYDVINTSNNIITTSYYSKERCKFIMCKMVSFSLCGFFNTAFDFACMVICCPWFS